MVPEKRGDEVINPELKAAVTAEHDAHGNTSVPLYALFATSFVPGPGGTCLLPKLRNRLINKCVLRYGGRINFDLKDRSSDKIASARVENARLYVISPGTLRES